MADFIDHSDETSSQRIAGLSISRGPVHHKPPRQSNLQWMAPTNLQSKYALGPAGLICGILSLFNTVLVAFLC